MEVIKCDLHLIFQFVISKIKAIYWIPKIVRIYSKSTKRNTSLYRLTTGSSKRVNCQEQCKPVKNNKPCTVYILLTIYPRC